MIIKTTEMSDQQIIELIRRGKRSTALIILYKHFPMVKKMILSRGGYLEDARDIFQESLIILCRKAKDPAFILTAQLSTYLFSICRFLWNDELKKRKYYISYEPETAIDALTEQGIYTVAEMEYRAKLAEKVINEIGDRCRELLLLFYNAGMKFKDIAAKMGFKSEDRAKNQKHKCLEAARNKLKELQQAI